MRATRFLILGLLLAAAAVCRAQDDLDAPYGEGWFLAAGPASVPLAFDPNDPQTMGVPPPVPGGASAIAEAITPEITALARGLENDPKRIFDFVHDHIRYVHYFGSHKGAELTLLERSGNDFDQCALLVALLRAVGLSPTYQFGVVSFPYTTANHQDYQHWVGTTLTNADWDTTRVFANRINSWRGFPFPYDGFNGITNLLLIQHVWVQLTVNGTDVSLDPSFKASEPTAGINLDAAMSLNTTNLLGSTGGTATGDYVQSLSETSVRSNLQSYTTTLLATLRNNYPNHSVQEIVGGRQVVSSASQPLSQGTAFTIQTQGGAWPVSQWSYIPTNLMGVLKVSLLTSTNIFYTPNLNGDRLSLTFSTGGLAQFWLQDNQVGSSIQTSTSTNSVSVTLGFQHPYGRWDVNANNLVRTNWWDQSYAAVYHNTNSSYVLLYAFEAAQPWLAARQRQLDAYRQQGLGDTSRQVQTETLNVMGLNWLLQTEMTGELIAGQAGVIRHWHHRIGRMAQEAGRGYYIDVYEQLTGDISGSGTNAASVQSESQVFQGGSYFASALEHGMIEQLQSSNLTAASTVKILELANTNSQRIYLASATNWTSGASVSTHITGYDINSLYNTYISKGYTLLIPSNGTMQIAGAGSWSGSGWVALQHNADGSQSVGMIIGGGYQGGYVSYPGATPNPEAVSEIGDSQPTSFSSQSPIAPVPGQYGADPVSMADGTFHISTTDLALGGAEPRGLNLVRSYNSSRRNSNLAAMAPGWLHNYVCSAAEVPAPLAGLGTTTPQQMAPMLVAARALLGVYTGNQRDPKTWTVTALIAKWGIDQLIKNGVSISLGEDTLQFVKQPDGAFTPPANCTATLRKTNSAYWFQQRHANTFKFDTLGRLATIVDQYQQALNLTYDSSNRVWTAADWKGRTLTFSYTGARLTSVGDGTRSVGYGYANTYSPQGDLVSMTDPESKTSTYVYDTNHQITATLDALRQLVSSNLYDSFGRITTQYSQGDPNKMWQIFWSGWQTGEQDPAGGKRRFFYDDKTRLVAQQDALGNLGQMVYDGQDHLVLSISPLNETNQAVYDGHNNLVLSIDPLGYTNVFNYDSQDRLTNTADGRGKTTQFGYNAQFSLTGLTNGTGDWVTYSYNPSDGTLTNRTDSGGTTSYGYDTKGVLSSITHSGGLGSEGFLNNAFGDVLSHTNARQFVTSFQYNMRRQLTNTVAPTNLTSSVSFDAVGNAQSSKDARGFTTSMTWSPTRKLLATTLPATPQGLLVITNIYDGRDWLAQTVDPLRQPTSYTNDAAGRVIAVTDPLLRTTTFGFDADGRRTATTNAALEKTRQQWDARGQLALVTDNAGHTVQRAYDQAGNQIILTNRNGKQWQFEFDGANRLTNTITPKLRSTKQVYNDRGLLQSVTEPSTQTATFGYDGKGRLTNRVDQVGTTTYQYDRNNNLTNVFENGKTNSWTFDAYDRVSSYRDPDGNLVQYRFDANGNVTSLVYPGNRTVTYLYDSLNRLTNVTDWVNRKTTLAYDLDNHLTSITRPNGTVRRINYDAAGQTTNIVEQLTSGAPIAFFRLNWDNAVRVQWEFAAPLPQTNATPPARTMTYNDDNQIATFQGPTMGSAMAVGYDTDGNLTSGPLTNDTFASYGYNARNQLTRAGDITYAYDPAGNRVAMTNGASVTRFVVNPNAKLSQVLMRLRSGVTNYYIYGLGLLYEITETATMTNTLTYHYDLRGSTIAFTDDYGNVTDRVQYSAYGMITLRGGTNDTPFLYNGRYGVMMDPNGLYFMRARYYNPYLCRFINPDPAGFGGGLNWYCYADGNPISLIDPFGLCAEGWGGATATWINQNVVNPLNSVSTPSTLVNWEAYNVGSVVGGLGDLLRVGQGSANATYNAQDGWDVAIGITQDVGRAAGISLIVGGGLNSAFVDSSTTATTAGTTGAGDNVVTLYHQGELQNGAVSSTRPLSTSLSSDLAHYNPGAPLNQFNVPQSTLNLWLENGAARPYLDLHAPSGIVTPEIRILPPASGQLNQFLIHP
jgi:RHS repeat-associated protein